MEDDVGLAESIMARHGIPEDIRYALRAVSAQFRAWGARAQVTRTVTEGDVLEFASRTWRGPPPPRPPPPGTPFPDAAARGRVRGGHPLKHTSAQPPPPPPPPGSP